MNATEMLVRDHQAIRALLAECEAGESRADPDAAQVLARLTEELLLHDRIEEEIFYPSLMADYAPERGSPLEQARDEHERIKELFREIIEIDANDDSKYGAVVRLLKHAVEEHFGHEEAGLIPEAERGLSERRLLEIGEHLEARKRQLRSEIEAEKAQAPNK
jgi:hemerythrin superfamily protein